MRRALLIIAALALAFPAGARADSSWMLDQAVAVAVAAYQPGCPVTASFADLSDQGVHVGPCEILLDDSLRGRWRALCTVAIHEVGHVVGEPHSPDPYSAMFAEPTWDMWEDGSRLDSIRALGRTFRARRGGGDPRCAHNGWRFLIEAAS